MDSEDNPPGELSEELARVADLLLAMEVELRGLALWSQQPPSPAALASTTPFCYDTIRLEQWLQWVLLPKMKAILEAGDALPSTSGIAPLAEEYFAAIEVDATGLLDTIEQFDELICKLGGEQSHR